jgi:hypothetical protein
MSVTRIIDIVTVALLVLVIGLRLAGAETAAIALGTLLLPVVGVVVIGVAIVAVIMNRGTANGQKDFSSLNPEEERLFVGHEQWMRGNSKRANLIGFGIAGLGFLLGSGIVAAFYTPCSKYCERPPSSCKTPAEDALFKSSCESACGNLFKQHGAEFIEHLQGCAFSNHTEGTCKEVVDAAIAVNLWCKAKD